MPAYGHSTFGATEGFSGTGLSPNAPAASALQPTAAQAAVQPQRLSRGQINSLRMAQGQRALEEKAVELDQGITALKDLQRSSSATKSETWLEALNSVPTQFRPFVDDFTLNCMGSEGAIANAENYMYGLIELASAKLGTAVESGGQVQDPVAAKNKLARYLSTFGPAKSQVQKCGELMLALYYAAKRSDRITMAQYRAIQDDLKAYTVNERGMIVNVVAPSVQADVSVGVDGSVSNGQSQQSVVNDSVASQPDQSFVPSTPEEQLDTMPYTEPGAMMPDSMSPVADDTVITGEEVAVAPTGIPNDQVKQENRLVALTKKRWFPYAATGLGVLAIYYMRKRDVTNA